jgi:ribonuclease D
VAEGAPPPLNESLAASLKDALAQANNDEMDEEPIQDARPNPAQKAVIERLVKIVDSRARELDVSAEILAPRGELKALAMGSRTRALRESHALTGWRREEIGTRLLEAIA